MAVDHEVDVHVPETGKHGHAFGRYHLVAGWYFKRRGCSHRHDRFTVNENDAVRDGGPEQSVYESTADQRFFICSLDARAGEHQEGC